MNYFRLHIIFITFFMSKMSIKCEAELCENPSVYSGDRFNNNTIRLFRQNDCWDLNGFPGEVSVEAKCSMKDYQFFNPVNESSKVVTVLEGSPALKDRTFKFSGVFWWSWYFDPKLGQIRYVATSAGLYWDQIPKDHGFDAVFHNGDKDDPMLIGLEYDPRYSDQYMKIHYFSTQNDTFVRKSSQYFDQNDFPKDLTDAFSGPPTSDHKYMVYVLKADNYCILSDKQKCTEWKPLKQLIGCSGSKPLPTSPSIQFPEERPVEDKGKGNEKDIPSEDGTGNEDHTGDEYGTGNEDGNGSEEGEPQRPPPPPPPPSGDSGGAPPPRPPPPSRQKPERKPTPRPLKSKVNKNKPILAAGKEDSTTPGGGAAQIVFSFLSIILSFVCFAFL